MIDRLDYWMDAISGDRQNRCMRRHLCHAFANDGSTRYIVLWSLQWEVIEWRQVMSGIDHREAMRDAIEAAGREGWEPEAAPAFGFVFLRRAGDRRLLMLTPRDPRDAALQAFNPFRAARARGG